MLAVRLSVPPLTSPCPPDAPAPMISSSVAAPGWTLQVLQVRGSAPCVSRSFLQVPLTKSPRVCPRRMPPIWPRRPWPSRCHIGLSPLLTLQPSRSFTLQKSPRSHSPSPLMTSHGFSIPQHGLLYCGLRKFSRSCSKTRSLSRQIPVHLPRSFALSYFVLRAFTHERYTEHLALRSIMPTKVNTRSGSEISLPMIWYSKDL